jgi:hypothetical protein
MGSTVMPRVLSRSLTVVSVDTSVGRIIVVFAAERLKEPHAG